jgi:hypothetical protein
MELPLYGTYMDKVKSGAGNFQGTFRLGTGILRDDLLMSVTRPGRYGLVCKRDEVPIWAGIIWSRTYASEANTVQLTAQTYESVFEHIPVTENFVQTGVAQETLLGLYIAHIQNQTLPSGADWDFGMTYTSTAVSAVTRSVALNGVLYPMSVNFLKQLTEFENGLDYTIKTIQGSNDTVNLEFRAMKIDLAPEASANYFDYPGTVSRWWYNENASKGATFHAATHNNSTAGPSNAFVENTDRLAEGYPTWFEVQTYSDEDVAQGTLAQLAQRQASKLKMPIASPTFELEASANFSGWNDIGKTVQVRVQDARFPDGQIFADKLKGWSLNPENEGQPELIRLQLEGEE